MENFTAVILAAGRSRRTKTHTSKLLLPLAGQPVLQHLITTVKALNPAQLIIAHYPDNQVAETLRDTPDITWIATEPRGTGYALQTVLSHIAHPVTLILNGDTPLLSHTTLTQLLHEGCKTPAVLTADCQHPEGLGRILRKADKSILKIIEEKSASVAEKHISEVNAGSYVFPTHYLETCVPQLTPDPLTQEYYITELMALISDPIIPVKTSEQEIQGVNTLAELSLAERTYQQQMASHFLAQGVHIIHPEHVYFRGHNEIAADVTIDIGVVLENVRIASGVIIEPYAVIKNSSIGPHTRIKSHTVMEGCTIGSSCQIGPFARLRAHTQTESHVTIGNFVETKKSTFGHGTKAGHLSYLGDATLGEHINIGAGVITCNYDGFTKHETCIADHAFIGSGTQLVAPVTIGTKALIGAGTTVTREAPAHKVTISYHPQRSWSKRSASASTYKEDV